MAEKTKESLNYIIQAINNIVEPKVNSLKYDKTYRAKVTEEIEVGVYIVSINGAKYTLKYNGSLNVGDIVRVKAPLNNFSDIYIEAIPGSTGGGEGGGTSNYNDLANKPILNTNNTSSQNPNANETIRGTISLHKISKTGNYNDLNGKPSLNFIPSSQKGTANGVATLDSNTKVPKGQLPNDTVYDNNYVHTDNNFTTTLKNKLDGIASGAQVNKIETVQKNGVALSINNKTVNVTVPTKTSELTNDSGFITSLPIATKTKLGAVKVGNNLTITADGTLNAVGGGSGVVSDTLPIGSVVEWYGATVPDNWLICNGQEISRTEYSELFSILDTTYGDGDGTTTFNLPNMSSRFAVGLDKNDTDFNALGKVGGSKSKDITHNHTIPEHTHTTANHTLTIAEMPNHGHGLAISGGTTAGQIDRIALDGYEQARWYSTVEPVGGSQPHNHGNTGSTPLTSNNNTNTNISTLPPYITVYYIIKAKQSQAVVATVVDNLNSTSSTDALSANQGRILKNDIKSNANMIDTLQQDIINIEDNLANKLVKVYTLSEDSNSFTIDGLDINKDGGIYDIYIQFKQNISNPTAVGLKINRIAENIYNYAGITVIGDNAPGKSYGKEDTFFRLGALRGSYTAFCRLTITQNLYSDTRYAYTSTMYSDGKDLDYENIAGQAKMTGNPNLTSITIYTINTNEKFLKDGTKVYIYKK